MLRSFKTETLYIKLTCTYVEVIYNSDLRFKLTCTDLEVTWSDTAILSGPQCFNDHSKLVDNFALHPHKIISENKGRKEGNVLFNDAFNTFYLWLYGVGHMVKDHSDCERGNPLPPHRLLFPINSKGSFIWITHTTAFVTPVVEHWLE